MLIVPSAEDARTFLSSPSGFIVEAIGWSHFFIISTIFLTSKTFEVAGPVISSFDEIFDVLSFGQSHLDSDFHDVFYEHIFFNPIEYFWVSLLNKVDLPTLGRPLSTMVGSLLRLFPF